MHRRTSTRIPRYGASQRSAAMPDFATLTVSRVRREEPLLKDPQSLSFHKRAMRSNRNYTVRPNLRPKIRAVSKSCNASNDQTSNPPPPPPLAGAGFSVTLTDACDD